MIKTAFEAGQKSKQDNHRSRNFNQTSRKFPGSLA